MDIDIEYKAEDELGKLSDDLRSVAAFLNAVVALLRSITLWFF